MDRIFKAFASTPDEVAEGAGFDLMPRSSRGKAGLVLLLGGFLMFLGGVLAATVGLPFASRAVVGGMLIFFAGGLVRVYSE